MRRPGTGAARRSGFRGIGGGPLWTPAALGSKLTLWLRPEGIVGSAPITAWTNIGSAGGSFTAVGSPVPGATLNGLASVEFNGTTNRFTGAPLSSYFSASQWHAFAVCNLDVVDSNGAPGVGYTNDPIIADRTGGYIWAGGMRNNAGTRTMQMGGYDSAGHAGAASGPTIGSPHLLEGSLGTDKVLHSRVDAGTEATDTMLAVVPTMTGTTQLGASTTDSNYLDGRVWEILVCNQQLSAAEVALVRAYLTTRYGPF